MAGKQYHYVGLHADTVYKGDKAIPVGHGMDPISLTDEDLDDERNIHLKENFVAVQDTKDAEVESQPTKLRKEGEK